MVVGLGLAVAGATFQGLLRNPLADPYVLGTASGRRSGRRSRSSSRSGSSSSSSGCSTASRSSARSIAVIAVYRLARVGGVAPMTSLLLTGYALGSLLAAGLAMAMYLSGAALRQIFAYLLGSFDERVVAAARAASSRSSLVASAMILLRARSLNGLLLGEEAAAHLGVDVRRERAILLGLATLMTAACVAVSGLIGFVGLVVPHVVRLVVGPERPARAAAVGAAAARPARARRRRRARSSARSRSGSSRRVIGAPFFLFLLRRTQRGYEL